MTASIHSLDEIRKVKQREGRPEWFDLKPTGDDAIDSRRQAFMDELWEWPGTFRDRPDLTIAFHYELSPDDEEEVERRRWQGRGLECMEQMRQRNWRFDDERFVEEIERALLGIREAAAEWREARKAAKEDSIIRKRQRALSSWKITLLARMFRYGVRRLDPSAIRAINQGKVAKDIETTRGWIARAEKDIESANRRLAGGVTASGKNKGQPLTPMRIYAIEYEIKRNEAQVVRNRAEIETLETRLAALTDATSKPRRSIPDSPSNT